MYRILQQRFTQQLSLVLLPVVSSIKTSPLLYPSSHITCQTRLINTWRTQGFNPKPRTHTKRPANDAKGTFENKEEEEYIDVDYVLWSRCLDSNMSFLPDNISKEKFVDFFNSLTPKQKTDSQAEGSEATKDAAEKVKSQVKPHSAAEQERRETFMKRALTQIGVSNSSQVKLLELMQKLESTYTKAATLLTDFEKDPDMNLAWHEMIPLVLFVGKMTEKVLEVNPSIMREVMVENKPAHVGSAELQVLLHYLDYADLAYDSDEDISLSTFLDRFGYVEVFHSKEIDFEVPGFYMAFHPGKKTVLIGIKGTSSMGDVFTDVLCENTTYLEDAYVHSGMKNGANSVYKRIEPFITHLFKPQGYSYTVVGHSLGAGVACLTAMRMKAELSCEHIKVFAYGCPPVADFKTASKADYITAIVNSRDVIPRVSLSNMRIMNKNLAVVKALSDKGLTVDQLVKNSKARLENKDGASSHKSIQLSELDTLDATTLTDADIISIMKGVSRDYRLQYEEDLFVPGKVYFLFEENKKMSAVKGDGTLETLRFTPFSVSALTHHMCDSYRDSLHQAIVAEGDAVKLPALDIESIAGAHIVCSGYRKFVVPDEKERKEVTFYKITTSMIQVGAEGDENNPVNAQVAQFVAWHRYTHFENLKKVIESYELGTIPSLPSKHMFTSPDSRVDGFTRFLKTVVSKAIKRENSIVLESMLDFLGAKEDSAVPEYIKQQVDENE